MKSRYFKNIHHISVISLFTAGLSFLPLESQARTEIIPEFTVAESFVKNKTATLDESGQITEIIPGITINYTQARLDLTLGYRLNAVLNSGLQGKNHESHTLDLVSLIRHIPNHWDTLVTTQVKQVNTSPDGVQVLNPINDSINIEQLRTFGLLTSYQGRIKGDVDFLSQLSMDYADFETQEGTDSIGINMNVNNYKTQSKISWSVALNSRKFGSSETAVSNNRSVDDQIDTVQGRMNYRINRKFSTFLSVEKSETSNDNLNDASSLAGVSWVPNLNTSVQVGVGSRGSDNTWSLDTNIKNRRLKFAANYKEGVTSSRSLIFEESTLQPGLVTTSQSLSITPILLKKGTVSLIAMGRRTDLTLAYFNETRNEQDINSEEEQTEGASFSAVRKLSRLSSVRFYLSRQDSQATQKNIIKNTEIGYNRELSKQVTLTIEIQSTKQESDVIANEFEQSIVGISLTAKF